MTCKVQEQQEQQEHQQREHDRRSYATTYVVELELKFESTANSEK